MDEKEKRHTAEAGDVEKKTEQESPVNMEKTGEESSAECPSERDESTSDSVSEGQEASDEAVGSSKWDLNETLDALEAALERPLLPVWRRFRELSSGKRLLVSCAFSIVAAGLVFLCFLPGIIRTVERNRAAEAAIQQALEDAEAKRLEEELAKAAEPTQREIALLKIAEHKHNVLTAFLSSEYSIQLRTCGITLSPAQLSNLYSLQETSTGYHFIPDREGIHEFIAGLCEEKEPDPVAVKYFNTSKTRDTVYYPENDTGFTPDIDKAADDLALKIALGEGGTVDMEYFGSSYCESLFKKMTGTGLEVSIDNQYLWLYYNCKVVLETPIVSGNVSAGDSTPRGKFLIYWITTDTYLKGATWYDYVSHWAPFYGNYGIHDAQWRDEFGGDIYLTDGSHGCINVPIDAMNIIAEYYYIKMPIVVY